MERDPLNKEQDSSDSSFLWLGITSVLPQTWRNDMKLLNIKSFIKKCLNTWGHPKQHLHGKAPLTSLLRTQKTVTMSPSPPFKGWESAGELGNSPFRVKFRRKIPFFFARHRGCVFQTASSHPCTLIPAPSIPITDISPLLDFCHFSLLFS